jgi:uroporphyrin-III C-methyltransferase
MKGRVFLVGAGPGDPDLLTLKALRLLKAADVVLHDDLVGPEILALIPSSAHTRSVGKRCGRPSTPQHEINSLLIAFASFGLTVVRLKGGDPSIFGRAGEEMSALRKAGVDFEMVPGVTSALAAAAVAQVSLTERNKASAVVFVAGRHANPEDAVQWKAYVSSGATLAIYMPGFNYEQTASQLIAAGLQRETPCAVISRATAREQHIHRTTLANLSNTPRFGAPTILLVGDVVATQVDTNFEFAGEWAADSMAPVLGPVIPEPMQDNRVLWGD